jgi:hypothetical protein
MISSRSVWRSFFFIAALTSNLAMSEEQASWTIRFEEKASIRRAMIGCYGTASYRYALPTLRQLREYFPGVFGQAGGDALFFLSDRGANGEYLAFDSAKSELVVIPIESASQYQGIVACICSPEYTYARDSQGHLNCTSSSALPPLGTTFLADRYEVIEEPGTPDTWAESIAENQSD